MKLKIKDLIYYYVLLICIVNLQFLMFADFTNVFNVFTACSAVILTVICFSVKSIYRVIRQYSKFINIFLCLFFGYYILETLYGLAFANIGFLEYVKRILSFLYILLVYPLTYLLSDRIYRRKTFRTIVILSVASLVMKTMVWWLFNYQGIDIMHYVLYEEDYVWQRNRLIRIRSSSFDALVVAFALYNFLFGKRKKLVSALTIAFVTWYANSVMQSRSLVITIAVTLFLTLILRKQIGWKKSVAIIALAILAIIILQSQYFDTFVDSFDVSTYSTSIRLQGLAFYMEAINGHSLLGLIPLNTYESVKGGNWRYYISDLGTLSKFFEYGIIGFVIFNLPFIRSVYVNFIQLKGKSVVALSMTIFTICFSYLSNDVYIKNNILALPMLVAVVEVFCKDQLHDPIRKGCIEDRCL